VTLINSSLFPRECENICSARRFSTWVFELVELIFSLSSQFTQKKKLQALFDLPFFTDSKGSALLIISKVFVEYCGKLNVFPLAQST
jgi:hypothetical protein